MGKIFFFGGVGLVALALILLLIFAIRRPRYNAAAMAKAVDDLVVTIPGQEETVTLRRPPRPVSVEQNGIDYETDLSAQWETGEAEDEEELPEDGEDAPADDEEPQPWWNGEPEGSEVPEDAGRYADTAQETEVPAENAVEMVAQTESEENFDAVVPEQTAEAEDEAVALEEPELPAQADGLTEPAAEAGSPAEENPERSADLEPMEGVGSE